MTDELDFAAAEALLLAAEFEDCRPLWSSSNYVFLAQMCGPGGEQFAAVYKPHRGEAPLWDFPDGLYQREAAAYQLANLLDWPFIPPTVIRDGPQGIGSVQIYIRHDQTLSFFEQRENPELVPQLKRMAVFDVIANNADRKGGHCLLDEQGIVWGIDHGLCFHQEYKLRSVIWDWATEPIPEEWLDAVTAAREHLAAADEQAKPLLDLISRAEAAALLRRIDRVLTTRIFPLPGPNRHYPWPLV